MGTRLSPASWRSSTSPRSSASPRSTATAPRASRSRSPSLSASLMLRRRLPLVPLGAGDLRDRVREPRRGRPRGDGRVPAWPHRRALLGRPLHARPHGGRLARPDRRDGAAGRGRAGRAVHVRGPRVLPRALLRVPWVAGRLMRFRAERERELEGRAAGRRERARIARELHDVVAHPQRDGASRPGGRTADRPDPAEASEALEAIEGTGREALDRDAPAARRAAGRRRRGALAPQPGLDLDELVDRARAPACRSS